VSAVIINRAGMDRAWLMQHDSLTDVLVRFVGVAFVVWTFNKLLRDPLEHLAGYYGSRSSREQRSPPRPAWWRGDRLHQRVEAYRKSRDELRAMAEAAGRRDADLVALLRELLFAEIPGPSPEWDPETLAHEGIRGAWESEQAAARTRREHHVMTVLLMSTQLDADLPVLRQLARRLRIAGRAADAETVERDAEIARRLAEWARDEVWRLLTAGGDGARPELATLLRGLVGDAVRARTERPGRGHRIWRELLAAAAKDRIQRRVDYLDEPRRKLLEAIADLENDHPDRRQARAELDREEGKFRRAGATTPKSDPWELVAQLAEQRHRSVEGNVDGNVPVARRAICGCWRPPWAGWRRRRCCRSRPVSPVAPAGTTAGSGPTRSARRPPGPRAARR
jgi:hypothetical protein